MSWARWLTTEEQKTLDWANLECEASERLLRALVALRALMAIKDAALKRARDTIYRLVRDADLACGDSSERDTVDTLTMINAALALSEVDMSEQMKRIDKE